MTARVHSTDWSWAPLAVAILAWAVQTGLGWALAGHALCDDNPATGLAPETTRWLIKCSSAAGVAVTLMAAVAAVHWRRKPNSEALDPITRERVRFVYSLGMVAAAIFTVALVWTAMSAWMAPVCGEAQ